MSSDRCRLSDLANIQGGYAFKSADFGKEGIAVIKIANIQPPVVLLEGVDRVAPEKLLGLERFKLQDGDILMAMTGATVGKVGRFKEVESAYLNQRVARLSSKNGKEFDDFIYAVVSQPGFDKLIEGASAGSAQANISASGIGSVEIPRLSEIEQLGIGCVARTIDDRITLLRETNTTLEAIAQALFKSWFVDFDPVHAKMQGRAPEGMDEATAALFPDSFEDSELGPVPKGWGAGTLDTLADLNPESWSSKHHPERILYVDLANAKAGQIDDIAEFSFVDAPSRARRVLREGDAIVGTVRPGNRSFARIATNVLGLTGSTGFAVLRAKEEFDQALIYIAATCDEAIDRLSHLADGGAYPAVRPEAVGSTPLVIPPAVVRKAFGDMGSSLFQTIGSNQERCRLLAQLRDTLLPRLISGQLRLEASEAIQ